METRKKKAKTPASAVVQMQKPSSPSFTEQPQIRNPPPRKLSSPWFTKPQIQNPLLQEPSPPSFMETQIQGPLLFQQDLKPQVQAHAGQYPQLLPFSRVDHQRTIGQGKLHNQQVFECQSQHNQKQLVWDEKDNDMAFCSGVPVAGSVPFGGSPDPDPDLFNRTPF